MAKKTYHLIDESLNCPCDSEQLKEMLEAMKQEGWKEEKNVGNAEIVIMKFCCITAEEVKNDIETIKNVVSKGCKGKLLIGFCMAKSDEIRKAITECLPSSKISFFQNNKEFFELIGGINNYKKKEEDFLTVLHGIPIVNITYGCKRKCAFCKVAYVNSEFRSVSNDEIISKVKLAKKEGYKTVILSAMNSTEYSYNGMNLADLLKELLVIPGMYYQVNGIVLSELSNEMIEVLKDKRFFYLQLEIQSFISEVRKNMNIGMMSQERILEIFKIFKGKGISSCIMVGCAGEKGSSFKEQLELIKSNNLYFLTVDPLVPTPGTKCAEMRNPRGKIVQKRLVELTRILTELKAEKARSLLGKTLKGIVMGKNNSQSAVLVDTGVLVSAMLQGASIGDIVEVTPLYVEALSMGENQAIVLSETETESSKMLENMKKNNTGSIEDLVIKAKLDNVVSAEELMFDFIDLEDENPIDDTDILNTKSMYQYVKKQFK